MNLFLLEGNLTREPETNLFGTRTVIKFSIAENTRTKDASGNYVDGEPNYYDIQFWTDKPDYWLKRLGKGTSVVVSGNVKQDRWEKDGQKHSKITFNATEIKAKWLPELNGASPQTAPQTAPQTSDNPEDIPF